MTVNLFGLFPIGRMRVTADEETRLMPGGAAVGVALATDGVLVIVKVRPEWQVVYYSCLSNG